MRYNIDYSFIVNHLFELTILGLLGVFALDFYGRFIKITKSTDEFDSTLVERYVILEKLRNRRK